MTPLLPASADVTVDVKSRTTTNGAVTLTVQSGGNLISGSDSIAIANLTWTAAGTGFAAGTMATTAVSLGAWTGGGTQSGTQSLPARELVELQDGHLRGDDHLHADGPVADKRAGPASVRP